MNQLVTNYQIVQGPTAGSLAKEVMALIVHGWQPYGNVYITSSMGYHCQPMVKYA